MTTRRVLYGLVVALFVLSIVLNTVDTDTGASSGGWRALRYTVMIAFLLALVAAIVTGARSRRDGSQQR